MSTIVRVAVPLRSDDDGNVRLGNGPLAVLTSAHTDWRAFADFPDRDIVGWAIYALSRTDYSVSIWDVVGPTGAPTILSWSQVWPAVSQVPGVWVREAAAVYLAQIGSRYPEARGEKGGFSGEVN